MRDKSDKPSKNSLDDPLYEDLRKKKAKDPVEIEQDAVQTLVSSNEAGQQEKEKDVKNLQFHSDSLDIPHKSAITDPVFLDILEYIKTIDGLEGWKEVRADKDLKIHTRMGSKYSSEFYISKLEFYFSSIVPVKSILDLINDDKLRKTWDKNFTEFTNLEVNGHEFILYAVVSVLTFKTESLEKKINVFDDGEVRIVGYSIEDERKPIGKLSRSHTFFTVSSIFEKSGRTGLVIYSQIDPKSVIAKMAISVYALRLNEWANKLRHQLEVS